jgi:hypothetical protein
MLAQFGPEFGDRLTETTFTSIWNSRYTDAALGLLKLSEQLGDAGAQFRQTAIADLTAYAEHAYDPADNAFWVTLTDGTRLTPADRRRPGGVHPDSLHKRSARGIHLWTYALAARLSDQPAMWKMVERIAAGLNLGRFPGRSARPETHLQTDCADVDVLFALLELQRAVERTEYLQLARRVGENLLSTQFHHGYFLPGSRHLFCRFDTRTPLALLHLAVALQRSSLDLPDDWAGGSFFHCTWKDGTRTYDSDVIYGRTRPDRSADEPPRGSP